MSLDQKLFRLFILLFCTLGTACAELTLVRQHPTIANGAHIESPITIAPTHIRVISEESFSHERIDWPASESAMKALFERAEQHLISKGYTVQKYRLPDDPGLEVRQENVLRKLKQELKALSAHLRLTQSEEVTRANQLNIQLDIDGRDLLALSNAPCFLLIDFVGVQKSAGALFSTAVVTGFDFSDLERSTVLLALIRSRDGQVLWTTSRQTRASDDFDLLIRALDDLPAAPDAP